MDKTLAVAFGVTLLSSGVAIAQDKKAAPPAAPAAPAAPAGKAAPPAAPPAAAPPAAQAMPPGPPQPPAELAAFMKNFDGSWKCETKMPAGALGPGKPETIAKSTVKFKKDFGGFFWRGEYEMKKQKGIDMGFKGLFFIGWDPGSKQLLMTSVDGMGGVGLQTGKIEGETANFTGDTWMMGQKLKVRESMGTRGPKEGWHKAEVDMGKGFVVMGEDTCKR